MDRRKTILALICSIFPGYSNNLKFNSGTGALQDKVANGQCPSCLRVKTGVGVMAPHGLKSVLMRCGHCSAAFFQDW